MLKKAIAPLIMFCFVVITFPSSVHASPSIPLARIGVLEFQSTTPALPDLGMIASDAVVADLVKLKSCEVIERARLKQLLDEQALNASGVIDEQTATKLGGILGLDYILTGSVFGNIEKTPGHYEYNKDKKEKKWVNGSATSTLTMALKLVDVRNGRVVWSDQKSGSSFNENIVSALNDAVYDTVRQIYQFIPVQGYVLKVDGDRYYIDLGNQRNIAVGDLFTVIGVGESIRHPVTGELIVTKKTIGILEVIEVGDNLCIAGAQENDDGVRVLPAVVHPGDLVSRHLRKEPTGFLGINWSGRHDY